MNKRQKKKRIKKMLLWEIPDRPINDAYFNKERYYDPTAGAAIENVLRENESKGNTEKLKTRRQAEGI